MARYSLFHSLYPRLAKGAGLDGGNYDDWSDHKGHCRSAPVALNLVWSTRTITDDAARCWDSAAVVRHTASEAASPCLDGTPSCSLHPSGENEAVEAGVPGPELPRADPLTAPGRRPFRIGVVFAGFSLLESLHGAHLRGVSAV